ncbi:helix-turn-helix domain-containing protein, partial [Azotobacter chroococcum]|nr:helix-turn-helix domain-containing protein [Azotobacter chroococcum]
MKTRFHPDPSPKAAVAVSGGFLLFGSAAPASSPRHLNRMLVETALGPVTKPIESIVILRDNTPMKCKRNSDGRAIDHHSLQVMRQQAIKAVREGQTVQSVAAAFGVNIRSVFRWL